ncbi:hypothetical protein E2C01_069534 [Portunus trituberculatus]|uniref:Uncharacterized protein n=1 Tax=Portunus trituberculatus TaxID=210409 RepID=A0A5B7HRT0_PORTR|nr:hypothetical protein [Portunus trituberculatus]
MTSAVAAPNTKSSSSSTAGYGTPRLYNVYSDPGVIIFPALPTPIYMWDFNARHPSLGDASSTPNRSGLPLLNDIRRYQLNRCDTGGATHACGGTVDHIITSGLVPSLCQLLHHQYQLARDDLVALQKFVSQRHGTNIWTASTTKPNQFWYHVATH